MWLWVWYALRICRRLWRITIGLSLPPISVSDACTSAYLFTPHALTCFCLVALGSPSAGPLGRDILCTVDLAAPALARSSAASLYTSLLCPYTCVMDTDALLYCSNYKISSHTSRCPTGFLPCAIHARLLYHCRLLKISAHHLVSLYKHSSSVLRTARILALTADTFALLLVCGPTTGSLMLSYSAWGKYTPYPARPLIWNPSVQAWTFVESRRKSGTYSASDMSCRKSLRPSASSVLLCVDGCVCVCVCDAQFN